MDFGVGATVFFRDFLSSTPEPVVPFENPDGSLEQPFVTHIAARSITSMIPKNEYRMTRNSSIEPAKAFSGGNWRGFEKRSLVNTLIIRCCICASGAIPYLTGIFDYVEVDSTTLFCIMPLCPGYSFTQKERM